MAEKPSSNIALILERRREDIATDAVRALEEVAKKHRATLAEVFDILTENSR